MISPEQLQEATARLAAQEANPDVLRPEMGTYDGQGQHTRRFFASLAGIALTLGIGAGAARNSGETHRTEVAVAAFTPTNVSDTILPNEVMGGIGEGEIVFSVNENTRRSIGEFVQGFAPEDLAFGEDIDMALHTPTRGATAFSQEGACSGEELQAFFLSGSPEAEAVKKHILSSETLTDEEKEAKLEGKGFLVMQVKKPAVLYGTTYYVDGEIRRANERAVPAGDLYLLSLKTDGSVDQESSARCDCINPEIDKIVPPTEGQTPPPTVDTTPPTSEVPPTTETPTTAPPEESTTTTPSSSSTSSTSTTSTSTTTSTTPETTTTTEPEEENPDKEDDEETPGPDDSPTPTTQPAPEGPAIPDDGSENPVGGTSTTTTSTAPNTTTTTPTGGPTTTAPQNTQSTAPQG